jgi:iron complex transport system substrate-binding protein
MNIRVILVGIIVLVVFAVAGMYASKYFRNGGPNGEYTAIPGVSEFPALEGDLAKVRLISLAPSITETLCALGLRSNLVGITDFCDYPPDVKAVEKIGSMISPSLERIVALKPDLVIMTRDGGNRIETARAVENAGLRAVAVSDGSLFELGSSIKHLGRILGREPEADKIVGELNASLLVFEGLKFMTRLRKAVWIVAREPFFAAGKETIYGDILSSLQMINVMTFPGYRELSRETLLASDVDLILDCSGGSLEWWSSEYPTVYRSSPVLILDRDSFSRPGPRFITALGDLTRKLADMEFAEK